MTAPLWTAQEIATATGGRLIGDDSAVTGISIDTRTLQAGDIFVALKGPNFDGHDFAQQALDNGASCVLVDRDINGRCIVVPDTFQALQDLGAGSRARSKAKIFAVTGSVGKTTAKEILAQCLRHVGKTHAAEASLNNHWGVPLTLARMPQDTRFAVFELGMNHANEISPLSKMVTPHIAIITTIAAAHIEYLGSLNNIALAKAEIFHGMTADGIAVLPRDSEQYPILLAEARTQGLRTIKTFGAYPEADTRLLNVEIKDDTTSIDAVISGENISFTFGIPGAHHALNALAVLTALQSAGLNIQDILPHMADIKPVSGRGNRFSIQLQNNATPISVVDETHNASPIAVEAALRLLAQTPSVGRRIAILGDMRELGTNAPQLHANLASSIHDTIDLTVTCGPLMANLAAQLPKDKTKHYPDSQAVANNIADLVRSGDTVLIKGSRGSKMRLVVDALQALGQIKATGQSKQYSAV